LADESHADGASDVIPRLPSIVGHHAVFPLPTEPVVVRFSINPMLILSRRRVHPGVVHPSEDVSIVSPSADPVAIQDVSFAGFFALRIH